MRTTTVTGTELDATGSPLVGLVISITLQSSVDLDQPLVFKNASNSGDADNKKLLNAGVVKTVTTNGSGVWSLSLIAPGDIAGLDHTGAYVSVTAWYSIERGAVTTTTRSFAYSATALSVATLWASTGIPTITTATMTVDAGELDASADTGDTVTVRLSQDCDALADDSVSKVALFSATPYQATYDTNGHATLSLVPSSRLPLDGDGNPAVFYWVSFRIGGPQFAFTVPDGGGPVLDNLIIPLPGNSLTTIPQTRVAADQTEAATNDTLTRGSTLLANLNRIRYQLAQLGSGTWSSLRAMVQLSPSVPQVGQVHLRPTAAAGIPGSTTAGLRVHTSTGALIADSFHRADGVLGTADVGGAYSYVYIDGSGVSGIAVATEVAHFGGHVTLAWIDSGHADCVITAIIGSDNASEVGIAFRHDTTAGHGFSLVVEAGVLTLRRHTTNYAVVEDMANIDNLAGPAAHYTITLFGPSITIARYDQTIYTTTATDQQTQTKHGLICLAEGPTAGATGTLAAWAVYPLPTAPSTLTGGLEVQADSAALEVLSGNGDVLAKIDGAGHISQGGQAVVLADGSNLPVMGASGGGHAKGAAPDPGSSAGTTRYLREDGSWAVPPSATSLTNPMIAEGDLIQGASAGAPARLALDTTAGRMLGAVDTDAAWVTPPDRGGWVDPTTTDGDLLYRKATTVTSVAIGFIGDSITANTAPGGTTPPLNCVADLAATTGLTLTAVNQGQGSSASADWTPTAGSGYLATAKAAFAAAGVQIVHVMLGTNDALLGGTGVSASTYFSNLQAICRNLVAAGYTVVLSYSPYGVVGAAGGVWTSADNTRLVGYQPQINNLIDGWSVRQGDTKAYLHFQSHQSELGSPSDGLHPNGTGSASLGQLWATALLPIVNASAGQTTLQRLSVGSGLAISGGALGPSGVSASQIASVNPGSLTGTGTVPLAGLALATPTRAGIVQPGSGLLVDGSGILTPRAATATATGVVKPGSGLVVDGAGALTPKVATATAAGVVKPDGTTTAVAPDGTFSVIGGAGGSGTTLSAKGDLQGYSTTPVRVPVTGVDGRALFEDSTQAAGVAWKALPAPVASSPLVRMPNQGTFISTGAADQPPDFIFLANGDLIGVAGA